MSNIDTIRGLESVHRIKAIESTYEVREVKKRHCLSEEEGALSAAKCSSDWRLDLLCSAPRYPGPHSVSQGDFGKISL